jgi:secondary thiamine-phosphate synthase enzyme
MKRFTLEVFTEGNCDVQNLNPQVNKALRAAGGGDGVLHLFVVGSTASLTTLEFEPGLVKHDLAALMQKLVPDDALYQHEQTWNDDNGHSHLRSALLGPGITIPFADGKLMTGEYQQVVLVDFDTRPRKRIVIGTVLT